MGREMRPEVTEAESLSEQCWKAKPGMCFVSHFGFVVAAAVVSKQGLTLVA